LLYLLRICNFIKFAKLVFSAAQIANKSNDPPLRKELKERSSQIAPEPKKCKKAIRQKRPSEADAHEHGQKLKIEMAIHHREVETYIPLKI